MQIDTLEAVQLGGITQWIRVRGEDGSKPVLLLMQQGPGLPIINDAPRLERLLGLEKAFTVVYWDQRGTGLSSPSLRTSSNRFEISVARMVDDTVTLLGKPAPGCSSFRERPQGMGRLSGSSSNHPVPILLEDDNGDRPARP